jgi:hypothetical protein
MAIAGAILAASVSTADASSVTSKYKSFRSICVLFELDQSTKAPERIDRETVSKSAASQIQKRLRGIGLDRPIETGRQCFRRTETRPFELSLWFFASLNNVPTSRVAAISLTVHSYYGDETPSPHEYPTTVAFCEDNAELSDCLSNHLSDYFDQNLLSLFNRGRSFGVSPKQ